jgi:hypothetical protein
VSFITRGLVALLLGIDCSTQVMTGQVGSLLMSYADQTISPPEERERQNLYQEGKNIVASTSCVPACLNVEVCAPSGCMPRFSALTLKEPTNGASLTGGIIPIVAELTEKHVTEAEWPVLVFTATRMDGSPVGSIPTPKRKGNEYTALWVVPNLDELVTVTAAYSQAGLGATIVVDVDTVAPTFTLNFSNPPVRRPGIAGLQAEHRDPAAGYERAFRRDETVNVIVSADDAALSQAQLTVVGIGPGGMLGRTERHVTVDMQPRADCPGGQPVCGEKSVDLSVPEMSSFRGAMTFRVTGQDRSGNKGQSTEMLLRVTRWRWAFDAAGRVEGTPAIGSRGLIYFGTNSGVRVGRTFGLGSDGDTQWVVTSGDVVGSPAVGAWSGGEESVYIAARDGNDMGVYAFRSDGTQEVRCAYPGSAAAPAAIAIGHVGVNGNEHVETAATIYNSSPQARIVRIRPDALNAKCLETISTSLPRSIAGAVVLKDKDIFYGTASEALTSYDISTDSNVARTGWPQAFPVSVPGLAILGENVYAGMGGVGIPSQGGIFKVAANGGAVEKLFPPSGGSRVFNLSIGSGEIAYFGAESGSNKDLRSLQLGTATPSAVISPGVGILRGAPVVGRGGNLYTVNTDGEVRAWMPGSATPLWGTKIEPGAGEGTNISPTLDCLRDASGQAVANSRLGVLYVTAETKVHAFIADSPGLDPDAPWPKYQHDARNTGNPATPITRCP